ncbi:MAG: hypothetical protein ACQEXN_15055 [Actinomycetota bacterium]
MEDIPGGLLGPLLAFVLPDFVMVALWALGIGYWGGIWLIGLPAWAILCRRWSSYIGRQEGARLALFVLLLAASSLFFVIFGFYPVVGPALVALLPVVPLAHFIASPVYRQRPLQAVAEFLLSCAVSAVALTLPEFGWASLCGRCTYLLHQRVRSCRAQKRRGIGRSWRNTHGICRGRKLRSGVPGFQNILTANR